jgi:hypothetical protein
VRGPRGAPQSADTTIPGRFSVPVIWVFGHSISTVVGGWQLQVPATSMDTAYGFRDLCCSRLIVNLILKLKALNPEP